MNRLPIIDDATLVFIERLVQGADDGHWYRTDGSFSFAGCPEDAVVEAYNALAEIVEFELYDRLPRRAIIVPSEDESEGGIETVILYTHGPNRAPLMDSHIAVERELQRDRAATYDEEFRSQK